MKNAIFNKTYLGIVNGYFDNEFGTINYSISRKNGSIIEREVNKNGQLSITHFKVLKRILNYSLIEFNLETGRTHQIRVHCCYLGHPLLGDSLYGTSSPLINRQALHCHKLEFTHPINKQKICIESNE